MPFLQVRTLISAIAIIRLNLILYRKKFAKLKVKFELEMRESEALVREQLRIEDVSKKLQETNE